MTKFTKQQLGLWAEMLIEESRTDAALCVPGSEEHESYEAQRVLLEIALATLAAPQLPQPAPTLSSDLLHMAASAIEDLLTSKDRSGEAVWHDVPAQLRRAAMLQGAEPAAAPEGWKLVPLIAFPSQWAAGQKAFESAGMNKVDAVYKAMVAAAPQQEIK